MSRGGGPWPADRDTRVFSCEHSITAMHAAGLNVGRMHFDLGTRVPDAGESIAVDDPFGVRGYGVVLAVIAEPTHIAVDVQLQLAEVQV